MRLLLSVVLLAPLVLQSSVALAQTSPPTLYIGPQIRDGFMDVDSGIRDSIRDLQTTFRTEKYFMPALNRDDATLVLIVLARGIVTSGSTGLTLSSGVGYVVPNEKPTLTTVLRVGEYERIMQSEGGTWRAAADKTIEDVMAWWEANRAAVEARTSRPSN